MPASAGRVDLHLAEPVEAVGEFAECAPCDPAERKELAAMSMTGKLKAHTGVLGDRQAGWARG